MKKKLVSILTAGAVATMTLAGCGGSSNTATGEEETALAETSKDAAGSEEGTSEAAIDMSEEPYEIAVQFIGLNESNNDLEAVEAAINEITLEKINATVDLQPLFIGDMGTTTSMGIAGGEKMDIVTVGLVYAMSSAVKDGVLLELDDLIAERGSAISEVCSNVEAAQKINGKTYAVSGYPYPAVSGGFVYNKTVADKLGLDMHDGMTIDDLTAVGETLKENGMYLTSFSNSSQLNFKFMNSVDVYGASGDYGVVMDPSNDTTVENIFATDEFKHYCETVKTWFDNGYLPEDQMTDTTSVQQHFANQKVFGTSTAYTPDQIAVWTNPDFETGIISMGNPIIQTSFAQEMMLGIAATSERPDKCMDLINLIYSDADVANLFNYGIEGTDYVAVDGTDNVITYDGTANADHSGYYTSFMHFGNPTTRHIVAPLTDEYVNDLEAFNDSAVVSKAFGYAFDAEAYSTQAAGISAVLAEQLPLLNAGQVEDVDAAIEKLVADLQTAGIDEVIAANQEQLDAYLAGN